MPKLGTIFRKKLLKMLATFSSSFLSTPPILLKAVFSTDFILLEKRGLTVAQIFLSSHILFESRLS